MKELGSLFMIQKHCVKPTLLDFNDWLNQNNEANALTKQTSINARTQ